VSRGRRAPKEETIIVKLLNWKSVAALLGAVSLVMPLVSLSAPAKAKKKPPKFDVKAGIAAYKKLGCAGCHTIKGKGGKVGPNLSKVGKKLDFFKIAKILRRPPSGSVMPALRKSKVPDQTVYNIAGYLSTLKK